MLGILLVGFERFDFLQENLDLVRRLPSSDFSFYISIDGPKTNSGENSILRKDLSTLIKSSESLKSNNFVHSQNMGCDKHISWAINWVLQECESVIVIEDDVRMSSDALLAMMRKLQNRKEGDKPKVILGISTLFSPFDFLSWNFWRFTRYFSAWGYGLNREFWKLHQESTSNVVKGMDWNDFFSTSNYWSKLSKRKRELWKERFLRGNYDYAIQATMFRFNIYASAPALRMVDNVGHGLEAATHTRFQEPCFLRYRVSKKDFRFLNPSGIASHLNFLFNFLDSNSWAGEGLLTSRGRTIGVRTIFSRKIKWLD